MPESPIELILADAAAWRAWLRRNHARSDGTLLVLAKKGTTAPTRLNHDPALEEAICFGWIDGRLCARDAVTFRQRFTPRRARSPWSQRNVAIAERLIEEGRMHAAGLAAIDAAKADGRWDAAYAGQAAIEMPEDLARALAADPKAASNFELLSSQNRYAILYRLHQAKRSETRLRRLEGFVSMLARGETIHPQTRELGS